MRAIPALIALMLMFSPGGVSSWENFFSGQNCPCSWLDNPPLEFSIFGQTLMAVGLLADMKTANFVTASICTWKFLW